MSWPSGNWSALIVTLVGGFFVIAAAFFTTFTADRVERRRWRRDAQLRASQDALSALQVLVRELIDLASSEDTGVESAKAQGALAGYHAAITRWRWNATVYAAYLVEPHGAASILPDIDREIDRLFDLVWGRSWTREEFREARRPLGRLAASYLDRSRVVAGLGPLGVDSIWTWEAADY